uniref:Probable RuBisCO transcriptional regulator n=1 Tax=Climaconeis sp. TaxID=2846830 RepID=A0A8F8X823_9STRA|nr:rubisco operon transcription regulator [Climaconeis sp.]QYB18961.1 rubisco operon transcription regulator [Climaconeis sp.]
MFPFTLQQLRILKAVAAEKNFTTAAQLLYLSQPSLSKQIKILEKNLDISIINREKQNIFLTENGRIFLKYSERILALCEEGCRALMDVKNIERGNLNIATNKMIATYLLPQILTLFAKNYPQISLKIQINTTKIIAKNIIHKEIDFAIVSDKIPTKLKNNLIIEYFIEDEFILIVSKFHSFAKKKKITKKDIYNLNFIDLSSSSVIKKEINNVLNQNHIEIKQLKIIMQLSSIEEIKTAVNLGLGVAFLPISIIRKEIKLKTIKILKIENIRITRILNTISNIKSYKSKAFEIFYTEFSKLN